MFAAGKPHNPLISGGAILVGALIQTLCKPDMQLAEMFDFVLNYFKVRSWSCVGMVCYNLLYHFILTSFITYQV